MRNWPEYHSQAAWARRSEAARHAAECRWAAVHAQGESADSAYQRARRAPRRIRITIEGYGDTMTVTLDKSPGHCRQWICSGALAGTHSATQIGRAIARAISWS